MRRILAPVGVALVVAAGCGPRDRDAGRAIAAADGFPHPALIAHRGASHLAPEATRAAYLLALELGADFLEMDIQRTRDGMLVALHDDDLARTTDAAARFGARSGAPGATPGPPDLAVEDFTWAEIRTLDAGAWFNRAHPRRARAKFRGLRVLTLDDILDLAEAWPRPPGLMIETKDAARYPGIEAEIVGTLRRRGWLPGPVAAGRWPRGPVMFQSFVPASLDSLRRLAPGVPRLLLAERGARWRETLAEAERLGASFAPHALDLLVHPTAAAAAHARGLLLYPWVVDEPWQLALTRVFRADGVFTNRVDAAGAAYGRPRRDVAAALRRVEGALGE